MDPSWDAAEEEATYHLLINVEASMHIVAGQWLSICLFIPTLTRRMVGIPAVAVDTGTNSYHIQLPGEVHTMAHRRKVHIGTQKSHQINTPSTIQ